MAVSFPVSVLFSHGYSKPLCSPNFPASSPGTHCSCVYTVPSLPPYHCARAALRLQSEQCPSNAASQSRNLTPFPVFHPLLVSYCLASPSLSHLLPVALWFTWLPKFPSYPLFHFSCNFQPPTVFHPFSLFKDFFQSVSSTLLQLFRYRCFSSPE